MKGFKYDATGSMSTGGAQVGTWDAEGDLVTSRDGTRLLGKADTGATTLYLDSTEIKLTGTTKTPQRWYQFPGRTVATRTLARFGSVRGA